MKDSTVDLMMDSLSREGRGVGRMRGKTVFVAGALPKETVRIRLEKQKPRYAIGKLLDVVEASVHRRMPECEYFGVCGGCVLQHMDHGAQLESQQQQVLETLSRLGKIVPEIVEEPAPSAPWGYRRRASLGVRILPDGGCVVGFRRINQSFIESIDHCMVLDPCLAELINPLRDLIGGLSVAHRIPRVDLAAGDDGRAVSVRHLLPLSEDDTARLRTFAAERRLILETFDPVSGVVARLAPQAPAALHYQAGDGLTVLEFQPRQFTQVNDLVNQELVRTVLGWLDPHRDEEIMDAFCGIGNFSIPAARRSHRVHGLDGDAGLICQAAANARLNGVENVRFSTLDLGDDAADYRRLFAQVGKLILDPARSGAVQFVKALPAAPFLKKIVYVSCDPATLARDGGILCRVKGYRLTRLKVAAMFPHTAHVECAALFEP